MNEEPTVEEFVRHLQVELEKTNEISDAKEREERVWQLEISIQESLAFRQRYADLVESGFDPLIVEKAVRLILSQQETEDIDSVALTAGEICVHCDTKLDAEIEFCAACGKYQ